MHTSNHRTNRFLSVCLLTIGIPVFCDVAGAQPPGEVPPTLAELARQHSHSLRLSVFADTGSVMRVLATPEGRGRALDKIRECGVSKIYIDLMRSGRWIEEALAVEIRDFFLDNGIAVSAGITTSPGEGFGVLSSDRMGYDWSRPETRRDLRRVAELAARNFDEVIVDDFFTFHCFDESADRARGGRDWEDYHQARMARVARDDLVIPIKAINPNCRTIIKYPQWYDKFHEFGYDIVQHRDTFDAVFAGTESRNPQTRRFGYVEPFEGYFNYSWIRSTSPAKTEGAWYDYGDMTPDVFREQGYQSVLAGAREIVLFNLANVVADTEITDAFIRDGGSLFSLVRAIQDRTIQGLHVYKPIAGRGSAGEYYIFDYLGMMGCSIVANSQPPDADSVLFSLHSMKDPKLPDLVRELDRRGIGSLTITAGLLNAWANEPDLMAIFGYHPGGVEQREQAFTQIKSRMDADGDFRVENVPEEIEVRFHLAPREAVPMVVGVRSHESTPILTAVDSPHSGKRCVLNLSTFTQEGFDAIGEMFLAPSPHPFMRLPRRAVDSIRANLDHSLPALSMPIRCGRYSYTGGVEVWENFTDEPVDVTCVDAGVSYSQTAPAPVADTPPGKKFTIPPRTFVIVERSTTVE